MATDTADATLTIDQVRRVYQAYRQAVLLTAELASNPALVGTQKAWAGKFNVDVLYAWGRLRITMQRGQQPAMSMLWLNQLAKHSERLREMPYPVVKPCVDQFMVAWRDLQMLRAVVSPAGGMMDVHARAHLGGMLRTVVQERGQ